MASNLLYLIKQPIKQCDDDVRIASRAQFMRYDRMMCKSSKLGQTDLVYGL